MIRRVVTIYGFMDNYGYGMMVYGGVFFGLLCWIIIIVVAYLLIKWLLEQTKSRGEEKSALDVAKERYAKGEITTEESEEIKKHPI